MSYKHDYSILLSEILYHFKNHMNLRIMGYKINYKPRFTDVILYEKIWSVVSMYSSWPLKITYFLNLCHTLMKAQK